MTPGHTRAKADAIREAPGVIQVRTQPLQGGVCS